MLEDITKGTAGMEDLDKLEHLALGIKKVALCGLGQTAPNPVLSTLSHFRDEYIAHVKDKKCPAKVCRSLVQYVILEDKCKGCGLCTRNCNIGAISGKLQETHRIDQDICLKCGMCMNICRFKAIVKI
jgi:ferredoxin